jgi:hypothetical protein
MSLTSKTPYDAFMVLPCFDIMEMIGKEVVQKRLDLDREFWMEIISQVYPPRTWQRDLVFARVGRAGAVERIKFYGEDYLEYVREFEEEEDPENYSRYPGSGSFIEYYFISLPLLRLYD